MGEPVLLDQQHILRTATRQLVGERRADRTAADDEYVYASISAKFHAPSSPANVERT